MIMIYLKTAKSNPYQKHQPHVLKPMAANLI